MQSPVALCAREDEAASDADMALAAMAFEAVASHQTWQSKDPRPEGLLSPFSISPEAISPGEACDPCKRTLYVRIIIDPKSLSRPHPPSQTQGFHFAPRQTRGGDHL